jgi:predicted metal-dependent phosphoesterase TrpH
MINQKPGPMTVYDLHAHSTASDGFYSPTDLVQRAATAGVKVLSLTDHDTTAGLPEADLAAQIAGIRVIPGVEVSVTWEKKTLHVVGLNIDADHAPLQAGLSQLQRLRTDRALEMGDRLENAGISGIFDEAQAMVGGGMITRTHFAHCLARRGLASDVRDVFGRYLTAGKPGYVSTRWVDIVDAIQWIRHAGGVAVLAHPQRYKLTGSWLRRLLGEFKEMGGEGLEVLSGTASPGDVQSSAALASRFGLLASCGSDFHGPDEGWPKLGRLPALPVGLEPVWKRWEQEATGE